MNVLKFDKKMDNIYFDIHSNKKLLLNTKTFYSRELWLLIFDIQV